jgi:hypothetical protein
MKLSRVPWRQKKRTLMHELRVDFRIARFLDRLTA